MVYLGFHQRRLNRDRRFEGVAGKVWSEAEEGSGDDDEDADPDPGDEGIEEDLDDGAVGVWVAAFEDDVEVA
jgi:hypothetical protein